VWLKCSTLFGQLLIFICPCMWTFSHSRKKRVLPWPTSVISVVERVDIFHTATCHYEPALHLQRTMKVCVKDSVCNIQAQKLPQTNTNFEYTVQYWIKTTYRIEQENQSNNDTHTHTSKSHTMGSRGLPTLTDNKRTQCWSIMTLSTVP